MVRIEGGPLGTHLARSFGWAAVSYSGSGGLAHGRACLDASSCLPPVLRCACAWAQRRPQKGDTVGRKMRASGAQAQALSVATLAGCLAVTPTSRDADGRRGGPPTTAHGLSRSSVLRKSPRASRRGRQRRKGGDVAATVGGGGRKMSGGGRRAAGGGRRDLVSGAGVRPCGRGSCAPRGTGRVLAKHRRPWPLVWVQAPGETAGRRATI